MYLTRKNNIIFIVGILVTMLIVAPILFFIVHPDRLFKKENKNIVPSENQILNAEKKAPFDEAKPTRTQEEIWTEYEKNISKLLSVFNTEEDKDVILSTIEMGFFDIFVPTEKRDSHFETLLQIQKLKSDGSINSKEKLKEYVVPLLNALLDRAQKN